MLSLNVTTQRRHIATQHGALLRILNRFCDCLIRLGPKLNIIESSPQFPAMVFSVGDRGICNRSFCEFISNDTNRMLFIDTLRSSAGQSDESEELGISKACDIMHIKLVDSHNREFPVQVCYTCSVGEHGTSGHLIGITEPEERTFLEATSSASSAARHAGTYEETVADQSVVLGDAEGAPIISHSTSFAFLTGQLQSEQRVMLELISEYQRTSFWEWLQEAGNRFCFSYAKTFDNLVLRLPTTNLSSVEHIVRQCRVRGVVVDDEMQPHRLRFHVALFGVQKHRLVTSSSSSHETAEKAPKRRRSPRPMVWPEKQRLSI